MASITFLGDDTTKIRRKVKNSRSKVNYRTRPIPRF